MEFVLALVIIAVAIYLDYWVAKQFYNVACMKGHTQKRYFWISFVFSIAGYLLVVALPDRSNS